MTDSLMTRAFAIVQDYIFKNEDFLLSKINESWPDEYAAAVKEQMINDESFDEDETPSFGFICEQIKKADEEKFLTFLTKIWD